MTGHPCSDPQRWDPWENGIRMTRIRWIMFSRVSHELPTRVTREDPDPWTGLPLGPGGCPNMVAI